ncbi:MAG: GH3 auxin-responsive promoter family protein [Bacteroidales bacterium]|nr:GH3 auxin-responsive promoter family protein [Bacteroidales bacterium]
MSIRSNIYSAFSTKLIKEIDELRKNPFPYQVQTFENLMTNGAQTFFGQEHSFHRVSKYRDYQNFIHIHQYEDLLPYIERIRRGESNVLWNQPITWFAKSSGTSGTKSKFIPISLDSLRQCHYKGMRSLMAVYLKNNPKSRLFNGKSLTLGGSCTIDQNGHTRYGDLSAILLANSPRIAEWFRTPPKSMALHDHFEEKVIKIAKYVANQDITNFSGVPSWNLVLMRKILALTGKSNLLELWPKLELFMHGGISFEPYRKQYNRLIPSPDMHYVNTYNASEGFFAFQDDPQDPALLLLPNVGIFYEFIPFKQLDQAIGGSFVHFDTMESVQTGVDYAVVISTNGGLWRYLIGDTIRFTSLLPHKFIITGRTKLFINVFGEELMIDHAEKALVSACNQHRASVSDYTVAPVFMGVEAKGAHEWLVEFEQPPADLQAFARDVDRMLCQLNSDYEAKRAHNATMLPLKMQALEKGCFFRWMQRNNKLGGQHKVPRLSGSRDYVEALLALNRQIKKING